ncbi:recombination protein RecR [Patescibacteria group bacterium]|nr:MAG: recombination protein RecR [Patescibacteria group bacterium]
MQSPSIKRLLSSLKKLPSVGQRTAERFIYHWLKTGKGEVNELRGALNELLANTKSCETCWDFGDVNPCPICRDPKRDRSRICVVAEPQDLQAIESTGAFVGVYHVLRGVLQADDEDSLKKIKIKELLNRVSLPFIRGELGGGKGLTEIILALNPDLAGEITMMYLEKKIKAAAPGLKVSRLAKGLPMGGDLQYADDITLSSAIKNRTTKSPPL